jgi:hypothetical protein
MLHNANSFNENITFLTSLNGNRWVNEDVANSMPGLLMVFNKQQGSNQYMATEYAQGQDGSVAEVTHATMYDTGFGHAIGNWEDGSDALFGYWTGSPKISLNGGVEADAGVKVNCSDNSVASAKPFYNSPKSCTFYSISGKSSLK